MSVKEDVTTGVDNSPLPATQQQDDNMLAVAALAKMMGVSGDEPIHNFPSDRTRAWKLSAIATGGGCQTGDKLINTVFNLRYFYAHPVRIAGESDGEFTDATRIVLIDTNDKAVAFVSEGAGQSLRTLVKFCGFGPWDKGLPVKIEQVQTRRGFRTYNIVPA